jgi:hypothetical protein
MQTAREQITALAATREDLNFSSAYGMIDAKQFALAHIEGSSSNGWYIDACAAPHTSETCDGFVTLVGSAHAAFGEGNFLTKEDADAFLTKLLAIAALGAPISTSTDQQMRL